MRTVNDLNKSWKKRALLFEEGVDQQFHNLQFNCGDMESKTRIIIALTFGKFIQESLWITANLSWDVNNKFLAQFVNDDNEMLAVVAMIGSMSDNVLQRILWEYNIDFTTPEAFLRRLTSEQIQLIRNNYNELIAGHVPRAYNSKRSLFGKKVNNKDLWPEDDWREWKSKGSWAYNLGNLDWGFNLYPGGANDDKQAPKIKPFSAMAKFVSIKGDKEQFVVDDIDGKYWKFYKSARNYGLFPDKEITIGKHICPGFWYTFLVHFLFWIVSPVCLIASAVLLQSNVTLWAVIPCLIMGVVTPLWCILATGKFLGGCIGNILEKMFSKTPAPVREVVGYVLQGIVELIIFVDKYLSLKFSELGDWCNEKDATIRIVLKTFGWSFIAVVGIFAHMFIAGKMVIMFNGSLVDAFVVNTGMYLYIGRKLWSKKTYCSFEKFTAFPLWMKSCIWLSVAIIWLHFMTIYGQGTYMVVTYNPAIEVFCVLTIILTGSIIFLPKFIPEIKEDQYVKIEQRIYWGTIAVYTVTAALVAFQIIRNKFLLGALLDALLLSGILLIITIFVGTRLIRWVFDPRFAKIKAVVGKSEVSWAFSVSHNKWLMSLDKMEARKQLRRVLILVTGIFDSEDKGFSTDNILQHVTEASLEEIESKEFFWKTRMEEISNRDVILNAFRLVSERQMQSADAYLVAKAKHDKKMALVQRVKKIFQALLFPVLIVCFPVYWIFKQLKRAKELYQLYVFFNNKICPHVEERTKMRF